MKVILRYRDDDVDVWGELHGPLPNVGQRIKTLSENEVFEDEWVVTRKWLRIKKSGERIYIIEIAEPEEPEATIILSSSRAYATEEERMVAEGLREE
jgi:hypothetical protein